MYEIVFILLENITKNTKRFHFCINYYLFIYIHVVTSLINIVDNVTLTVMIRYFDIVFFKTSTCIDTLALSLKYYRRRNYTRKQ